MGDLATLILTGRTASAAASNSGAILAEELAAARGEALDRQLGGAVFIDVSSDDSLLLVDDTDPTQHFNIGIPVGDRLYVIKAAEDSVVTVYDKAGALLGDVRLPLEPLKMTAALRAAIIKPLKESWTGPTPWDEYEKRLFFPDRTRGLDYFEVVEGKFVTRTYKYDRDLVEFAVFDLQGRELRRMDLPFTGRLSNGILFCFY